MTLTADLLLALRLARRELRSGVRGFGIFLACLTLGVGAMATVGLMTASLKAGLSTDAARILGGDLSITLSHREAPEDALDLLSSTGTWTHTARMRTMARTPSDSGQAALTEIKAVDRKYPLYGKVTLRSGKPLQAVLDSTHQAAIVGQDLLDRLGAKPGDDIRLGATIFTIADVVVKEPDLATTAYGSPRTFIKLDALEATKLVVPGALITHGYGWRAAPGQDAETVRQRLTANFPDAGWRIQGISSAGGGLGRFLDYLGLDLSLVALATLLLGGIGVAGGVSGHLARRDRSIAAMKCLGASRRTVQATYLFQILVLTGLGSILGLTIGGVGAYFLATFLADSFDMPLRFGVYPVPVFTALAYGLLTGLGFSIWPLSAAARTTPARLFTGYADPGPRRPSLRAVSVIVIITLALMGLTWFAARDERIALGFFGAMAAASLIFGLLALSLRFLARTCRRPKDPRAALAVSNLHRPGSATTPTIFSLGFGLTVLCCVALVDGNLRANVERIMPHTAPSYFFVNIRSADWDAFQATIDGLSGIRRMEATPVIRGRITGLAGRKADASKVAEEVQWALRGDRFLTWGGELPSNSRVAEGTWWAREYSGPPLVSLEKELAKGFGVKIGDTMTFNVLGRTIEAQIANTRTVDWRTLQLNQAVVFSPGVLEGAPYTWLVSVHATDAGEEPLFRAVTGNFPDAVALYIKDILSDVSEILGHVGTAAGSASALTLLVGLMILGEAVRGTLRTRRYDLVVFKVFGATRRDVLLSLTMEFMLQGVLTATVAAALGALGAWLFVTQLLELQWTLQTGRLAVVALGGVAVVVFLGLFGVRKALSQKAWPLLRND